MFKIKGPYCKGCHLEDAAICMGCVDGSGYQDKRCTTCRHDSKLTHDFPCGTLTDDWGCRKKGYCNWEPKEKQPDKKCGTCAYDGTCASTLGWCADWCPKEGKEDKRCRTCGWCRDDDGYCCEPNTARVYMKDCVSYCNQWRPKEEKVSSEHKVCWECAKVGCAGWGGVGDCPNWRPKEEKVEEWHGFKKDERVKHRECGTVATVVGGSESHVFVNFVADGSRGIWLPDSLARLPVKHEFKAGDRARIVAVNGPWTGHVVRIVEAPPREGALDYMTEHGHERCPFNADELEPA